MIYISVLSIENPGYHFGLHREKPWVGGIAAFGGNPPGYDRFIMDGDGSPCKKANENLSFLRVSCKPPGYVSQARGAYKARDIAALVDLWLTCVVDCRLGMTHRTLQPEIRKQGKLWLIPYEPSDA